MLKPINWLKKDHCAHFSMLSSMRYDIIGNLRISQGPNMWNRLKIACCDRFATKLHAFTLKSKTYLMDPKHTITKQLLVMSTMIRDFKVLVII